MSSRCNTGFVTNDLKKRILDLDIRSVISGSATGYHHPPDNALVLSDLSRSIMMSGVAINTDESSWISIRQDYDKRKFIY